MICAASKSQQVDLRFDWVVVTCQESEFHNTFTLDLKRFLTNNGTHNFVTTIISTWTTILLTDIIANSWRHSYKIAIALHKNCETSIEDKCRDFIFLEKMSSTRSNCFRKKIINRRYVFCQLFIASNLQHCVRLNKIV